MVNLKYAWAEGTQFPVDAQVAGEHVDKLKRKQGRVTPEMVVEDARKRTSPLHNALEWDDTKAAARYRLRQAGKLLRSLTIEFETTTPEGEPERVRAFVIAKSDKRTGQGRGFVAIQLAMNDPDMRAETVAQAKREFEALREKYRKYKELAEYVQRLAIDW